MKRKFTLLSLMLFATAVLQAQNYAFHLSNILKFTDGSNDTIPYPFMGGFVAPQFSEIDMNGDNIKDLFVFDRSGDKKMTFLNRGQAGKIDYVYAPQFEELFPELTGWVLLRDYNCDGKEDIFTGTQASYISVYKNTTKAGGKLEFTHITEELLDQDGNNIYNLRIDMPAIDDVDGDGDIDFLAFDVFGGYVYFYENRRVDENLHCDSLKFKWVDQCWGSFVEGGLNNSIYPVPGNSCFRNYGKGAIHSGSTILTFDSDGDGDKDAVLGDVDYPTLTYIENGKIERTWPYDTIISNYVGFPASKKVFIERFPAAFYLDIDNNGKKDLIVSSNETAIASNKHQIWVYKNSGQNNNPNFNFYDSSVLQNMTLDYGSGTSPRFFDIDGDGDLDILMVYRGSYMVTKNLKDRVALFTNKGTAAVPVYQMTDGDWNSFGQQNLVGLRLSFGDLNGDGLQDMLCGTNSGNIVYYTNTGTASNPVFTKVTDDLGGIDVGSYSTPLIYDLDGDTLPDLLVGSNGGTLKFFSNRGDKSNPAFNAAPDVDTMGKVWVNDYVYNPIYDEVTWEIIDSTKSFHLEGFSDPQISDLNGDGKPELVVGSLNGIISVYEMNLNNLRDSFTQIMDYFQGPNMGSRTTVDFGARTSLACADLNNDSLPDLLIGNSRGGLHYLSSTNDTSSLPAFVHGISLPKLRVSLYPNPAFDHLNVTADLFADNLKLEVYDITGRKISSAEVQNYRSETIEISTTELTGGAYFVKISAEGYTSSSHKFLVIK